MTLDFNILFTAGGIGAVKLSYFSCFSFLITASIIFVSNILVNIKDYNKEFLTSDKSAKRFIIAYNASLAFFGLFIFVVVFLKLLDLVLLHFTYLIC